MSFKLSKLPKLSKLSLYSSENPSASLTWAYAIALGLIAILTLVSHSTTIYIMKKQKESTEISYHLGRQRTVVQHIPPLVEKFIKHRTEVDRDFLIQALNEVQKSHKYVAYRIRGEFDALASDTLNKIYFGDKFNLNGHLLQFLNKAEQCSEIDLRDNESGQRCEETFLATSDQALKRLRPAYEVAMEGYQTETIHKIEGYHQWQVIATGVILFVLLVEALFIFRPLVKRINTYHRLLRRQALEDPLTGLRNRRAFTKSGTSEIRQAERAHENVGVALMDLDKFKNVNDTYGHDVGDAVLKHFSALLKKHLRQGDIVGRIGGEEFAVVLARPIDEDQAVSVLDRFRAIVENMPCEYNLPEGGQGLLSYTVSIGVVVLVPSGESISELLRQADEALYEAKETGRNQVALSTTKSRAHAERVGDVAPQVIAEEPQV